MTETRHTFTVPPGHYAVRDADGRATGETRPLKVTLQMCWTDEPDNWRDWVTCYSNEAPGLIEALEAGALATLAKYPHHKFTAIFRVKPDA